MEANADLPSEFKRVFKCFFFFLQVLKVHLSDHPEVYGRASGDVTGDRVNKNLLFDSSLEHLYITTEKKVGRTIDSAVLFLF